MHKTVARGNQVQFAMWSLNGLHSHSQIGWCLMFLISFSLPDILDVTHCANVKYPLGVIKLSYSAGSLAVSQFCITHSTGVASHSFSELSGVLKFRSLFKGTLIWLLIKSCGNVWYFKRANWPVFATSRKMSPLVRANGLLSRYTSHIHSIEEFPEDTVTSGNRANQDGRLYAVELLCIWCTPENQQKSNAQFIHHLGDN